MARIDGGDAGGQVRRCSKCRVEKPLSGFNRLYEGYQPKCKDCRKAHYRANAETVKAKVNAYRLANLEKIKARKKAYCVADRPKRRLWQREWRRKNRPRHVAQRRAYHEQNRDKILARAAAWKRANMDRVEESNKKRDVVRSQKRLRRGSWPERLVEFNDCCAYCLGPLEDSGFKKRTQDHMQSFSRGGEHVIENIIPACQQCNSRKGAKSLLEFAGELFGRPLLWK